MGKYVFGVDVGGTTVKLGLFDVQGTVKDKWEIPTVTTDNGVNIIPDIAESILAKMQAEGIEKSDVVGIGMGVLDRLRQMVQLSKRLIWVGVFSIRIRSLASLWVFQQKQVTMPMLLHLEKCGKAADRVIRIW